MKIPVVIANIILFYVLSPASLFASPSIEEQKVFRSRIVMLLDNKKYEEAVSECESAIKADSKYSYAWKNLGDVYSEQNKIDEAIKAYQHAIDVVTPDDPTYSGIWYGLASCLKVQQKTDEAVASYKKAIECDKTKSPRLLAAYWGNLSRVLMNQKKYQEAYDSAKNAVQYDTKGPAVWNIYGLLANGIDHKFDEAIKAFRKATELDPKYGSAWYNLALYLHKKGQNKDSEKALLRAYELNPEYKLSWEHDKASFER